MMIGSLMQKGAMRLPEVGAVNRPLLTVREVLGANRKQAMVGVAGGIVVIALGFAGVGYLWHAHNLTEAQFAATRVETANIDLQDELAHLRDQIAASNRGLIAAQNRVVSLTEEMRAHAQAQPAPAPAAEATPAPALAKGEKVTQLSQALHVAEAERATLAARLSKAEADLAEQQAKQADLLNQIDQWQKKLDQISSDRDRLKARVGELEKQSALRRAQQQTVAEARPATVPTPAVPATTAMVAPAPQTAAVPQAAPASQAVAASPQRGVSVLNTPQPAAVAAAPVPQVAAVAPPPAVAAPVPASAPAPQLAVAAAPAPTPQAAATAPANTSAVGHSAVDHFARVLASTGVDVRHLFAEFGVNRAEGGPVIPLARGQAIADTALTPEKLAALRAMVKVLPVSAPLDSFEITSPFGARGDPEDGRGEFHTGVDLAAAYDTPVYATAPGVVTFAGYRDDYGKIVEIDHGNGIATRYAHLHAFTVSVGQRVGSRQQVGYLGSTGRATGPHVHYEVVVNGEPQDPEKFFALSRYVQPMTVPVAARQ
jgi:murein DD-endopeptidase MepM/ murein hydrolase activator NlpD